MQEVRRLRQERGWTQTELAFYSGLAPSVISQIENDKRDPSASTLRKLARAFEVEVGDLFPKGQAPLPDLHEGRRETDYGHQPQLLRELERHVKDLASRYRAELARLEQEGDPEGFQALVREALFSCIGAFYMLAEDAAAAETYGRTSETARQARMFAEQAVAELSSLCDEIEAAARAAGDQPEAANVRALFDYQKRRVG